MQYLKDFLMLLADDRIKVALGAFVITFLATLGVPKDKQDQIEKLIYTGGVLATALIAGMSYEKGKGNEGTVPDGRRSVYDNTTPPTPPAPPAPPAPQQPTQTQPQPAAPAEPPKEKTP